VASESERPEDDDYNHVAAGLAVLAAIAASDVLCCRLLGELSRGQVHREAIGLVASVRFGEGDERARRRRANSIAHNLARALDLKDQSHYGVSLLEPAQVLGDVRKTDAQRELITSGSYTICGLNFEYLSNPPPWPVNSNLSDLAGSP